MYTNKLIGYIGSCTLEQSVSLMHWKDSKMICTLTTNHSTMSGGGCLLRNWKHALFALVRQDSHWFDKTLWETPKNHVCLRTRMNSYVHWQPHAQAHIASNGLNVRWWKLETCLKCRAMRSQNKADGVEGNHFEQDHNILVFNETKVFSNPWKSAGCAGLWSDYLLPFPRLTGK